MLASRCFALRAVVGSSGPEALRAVVGSSGPEVLGAVVGPSEPEAGVQSSSVSVASWPLPASGPEDYSPEGALVNRATLMNLVSTNVTVYFRDSEATNFNQRFYRAVVRRV